MKNIDTLKAEWGIDKYQLFPLDNDRLLCIHTNNRSFRGDLFRNEILTSIELLSRDKGGVVIVNDMRYDFESLDEIRRFILMRNLSGI